MNRRMKPTLNYALMDGIWCCRSKQSKTGGRHADWSQWNQVEVQSADSKRDRVWNWGGGRGGALKGTDEDEEEEDGGQDGSCPTKLSGEPGIESLPVVTVTMGCREM